MSETTQYWDAGRYAWIEKLAPLVEHSAVFGADGMPVETAFLASIAISLKRIADVMEGNPHTRAHASMADMLWTASDALVVRNNR